MFSHIMIGANDIKASKKFYDATLGTLGHGPGTMDDKGRVFYFTDSGILALTTPIDGEAASGGNGSTIGFTAADTAAADNWHKTGLDNGGTAIEDPPGIREGAVGKLYLAYLRDPSGNKICALHRIS